MQTGILIEDLVQVGLTGMAKRSMAHVMAQGDGFDQIQIQMKGTADGAGDAGHQLYMETAAGHIIIFNQGKHLSLICIAIIIGAMHDFIDIVNEGRAPYRCLIGGHHFTADHIPVIKSHLGKGSIFTLFFHLLRQCR